jgi:hypothetical protein
MTQKQWPHPISRYFDAYAGWSGPSAAARMAEIQGMHHPFRLL